MAIGHCPRNSSAPAVPHLHSLADTPTLPGLNGIDCLPLSSQSGPSQAPIVPFNLTKQGDLPTRLC